MGEETSPQVFNGTFGFAYIEMSFKVECSSGYTGDLCELNDCSGGQLPMEIGVGVATLLVVLLVLVVLLAAIIIYKRSLTDTDFTASKSSDLLQLLHVIANASYAHTMQNRNLDIPWKLQWCML